MTWCFPKARCTMKRPRREARPAWTGGPAAPRGRRPLADVLLTRDRRHARLPRFAGRFVGHARCAPPRESRCAHQRPESARDLRELAVASNATFDRTAASFE